MTFLEEQKSILPSGTMDVSELNSHIRELIDVPRLKHVVVIGEVSGFKFSSVHAYFTLKDKYSQIQCNCFNARKTYVPKDGESVLIEGNVDYWEKGGRLTLNVNTITPMGQGLLFLEFEKLKKQLEAEGLFDPKYKKPIPEFPKNVLVVTSKTGAVIRDIVTTVRRKNPIINIVVRDVRVQGEYAAREITEVLKKVDTLGYDVIIIARGGGSLEDLAPFYDETLVRTVFSLNTPVISAVGHETDFSLCDFVADSRAATPTAAGELIAYDYYGMVEEVLRYSERLRNAIKKNYEKCVLKTNVLTTKLSKQIGTTYIYRMHRVENALNSIKVSVEKKVERSDSKLEKLMDGLNNLSPIKVLKRGYFKVEANGKVAKVKDLNIGDTVSIMGGDGEFDAKVSNIRLNGDK